MPNRKPKCYCFGAIQCSPCWQQQEQDKLELERKMDQLEAYATSPNEGSRHYPTDTEVQAKMKELGIPQD